MIDSRSADASFDTKAYAPASKNSWPAIGSAVAVNMIIVTMVGVLIGTMAGERLLLGLSPRHFGQTIGGAIGALGIWMLVMPV